MLHHAVLTVAYAIHGPDHRTYARWTCLLCGKRGPTTLWPAALRAVDQHLVLTHRVAAPAVRLRDAG